MAESAPPSSAYVLLRIVMREMAHTGGYNMVLRRRMGSQVRRRNDTISSHIITCVMLFPLTALHHPMGNFFLLVFLKEDPWSGD